MNAECASCRASTENMGAVGDIVTGETMPEATEGDWLVCGKCAGLNRYDASGGLVQGRIEDAIKEDLQLAANIAEAQVRIRERGTLLVREECNRKMCFNAARWRLFFLLWTKGSKGPKVPPYKLSTGLNFCDCHCEANPDVYIGDDGWNQILASFDATNRKRPHRASTSTEFRAIDSEEVRVFDRTLRTLMGEKEN